MGICVDMNTSGISEILDKIYIYDKRNLNNAVKACSTTLCYWRVKSSGLYFDAVCLYTTVLYFGWEKWIR